MHDKDLPAIGMCSVGLGLYFRRVVGGRFKLFMKPLDDALKNRNRVSNAAFQSLSHFGGRCFVANLMACSIEAPRTPIAVVIDCAGIENPSECFVDRLFKGADPWIGTVTDSLRIKIAQL